MLPVIHSPVLVAQGEVQSLTLVVLGEQGTFLLHHSLQTSTLQMAANCFIGEGLVGDGLEGMGNLGSSGGLPSVDKTDGMSDISGGKLGWTTTRGLGNMGAIFRPDTSDSRSVMASNGGYLVGRVLGINEMKDIVKLCI